MAPVPLMVNAPVVFISSLFSLRLAMSSLLGELVEVEKYNVP